MKSLNKILLIIGLLTMTIAANAQFRRYYPPQNRWHHNDHVSRDGSVERDNRNVVGRNSPTNLYLNINYAVSQPLGSLKDYADKTSFRGWNISLLYAINPKWQVGLSSGFYDYYQQFPRKLYHSNGSDISAVQTHTLQLIPIQPTVLYFPGEGDQKVKPYFGLGIGVTDVNYKLYWGKFAGKDNSFAFSASPVVGIRIPFTTTSPLQFNADVKYNFVGYNKNNISSIHTVEANVGLSIHIR